jgi:hypothetical protein
MIGTMGASVGTAISHRGDAQAAASHTFRTAVQEEATPIVIVKKNQGWDI